MPQLRLAMAQVDAVLGDLAGNARTVREWTARAADEGAHLVAFPEMALTGYPVEDLALRSSFVEASRAGVVRLATDLAADGLGDVPIVVGYIDRAGAADTGDPQPVGIPRGARQNATAVLFGGRVEAHCVKHHLPTYGVFDEARIFVSGQQSTVIRVHGIDVALAICDGLWQEGGPVSW